MKFIQFLVLLLLIIPSVLAADIDTYSLDYTIISDKISVKTTIEFQESQTNLELTLPQDAKAIEVKELNFETIELSDSIKLIIQNQEFNIVELQYITESLVEKSTDYFFITDLSNIEANNINIKLTLPEKAILKYPLTSNQASIIPSTSKVTTDGKSIMIQWDKSDLISKTILVIYNQEESNSILLFILIPILIIAIALFFIKLKPKAIKQKSSEKDITKNLFEEEKKIVEVLLENKEGIWQKQLQLKTGLTKVKLSRKIRNLEEKGVLEKIPYGNTNKIRLKSA